MRAKPIYIGLRVNLKRPVVTIEWLGVYGFLSSPAWRKLLTAQPISPMPKIITILPIIFMVKLPEATAIGSHKKCNNAPKISGTTYITGGKQIILALSFIVAGLGCPHRFIVILIVAGLGLEPRFLGPEPSVLPLDDPAISVARVA